MIQLTEKDGSITFAVRVLPKSSRSEIVGEINGALKIKLNAPPVDGAANAELIKLLAKRLGVAKSAVEILSGHASRQKQIRVSGVNQTDVLNLIGG
ncbi:MAG: DUF167 domain-containing protein [Actinomycetota bacterium]